MSTRLYVGNLSTATTDRELQTLFATVGTVKLVILPTEHQTGARKPYGFVEMETEDLAHAAVVTLNGHQVHQRPISVKEIDPPEERRIKHSEASGFRQQKRGGWRSGGERK